MPIPSCAPSSTGCRWWRTARPTGCRRTKDGLRRIAAFSGFSSLDAFSAALTACFNRVAHHYGRLFESAPDLSGEGGNLVFTGTEDDPETTRTLREMGFTNPAGISALIRGWHHGHRRATRSERRASC